MTPADIHAAINAAHVYRRAPPPRDVWQTPAEFDATGQGDCEDFAIAYWHALRAAPGHARLMACQRADGEMHMVCLYWAADDEGPWVLDVAADAVCHLRDRDDLSLIFVFDAHGLYADDVMRPAGQVGRWADVLARMARQEVA